MPDPQPDPVKYPTNIDTTLLIFYLNNGNEISCADLSRLIDFLFSVRLNSDPVLVQYLIDIGVDVDETEVITATSTSTTSLFFTKFTTQTVRTDSIEI
ncbi:hypothetical protein K7432_017210, partial [Basidiobolus ranarum]